MIARSIATRRTLLLVPLVILALIFALLILRNFDDVAASVTSCAIENSRATIVVHCTNRLRGKVTIGFDVRLVQNRGQTRYSGSVVGLGKAEHVGGVVLLAKEQKDERVQIPVSPKMIVADAIVENLVYE